MNDLKNISAVDAHINQSFVRPVILYIYSVTCSVSARAQSELISLQRTLTIPIGRVTVQDSPDVSAYVEKVSGIIHESPQVLLYHHGHVIADWDHGDICGDIIFSAVMQLPSTS